LKVLCIQGVGPHLAVVPWLVHYEDEPIKLFSFSNLMIIEGLV